MGAIRVAEIRNRMSRVRLSQGLVYLRGGARKAFPVTRRPQSLQCCCQRWDALAKFDASPAAAWPSEVAALLYSSCNVWCEDDQNVQIGCG